MNAPANIPARTVMGAADDIAASVERMIALQIAAYPTGWTDAEYREMAVQHLFGREQSKGLTA